jgi:uncharacterized protein YndB with AHSA1/START domain
MGERSIEHASFTIERRYDVPPSTVFAAWADAGAKARWFSEPGEWVVGPLELDFRVGGREVNRGSFDGDEYRYEARYHDIVEADRIVYTYDMYMNDTRISVSLGSVELEPAGAGTKLTYTENTAFFDGADTVEQRQGGTEQILDALGEALKTTVGT